MLVNCPLWVSQL